MSDLQLRARVVLEEAHALGIDLVDLIAAGTTSAARIPTVAAYLRTIMPTFTSATAATYWPYWRLAVDRVGDRRLAEVTIEDLTLVVADADARARRLRPAGTGRASRETCVAALRALFARASAAGLIAANPAAVLTKSRRARSRRRALDDVELAEVIAAVRTTSGDPDLDLLVVRFHLESGARRQGALNLRRIDLDPKRATVWLREKGDSEQEQPVSPSLVVTRRPPRTSPRGPRVARRATSTGRCSARPTGDRCRPAATTPSSPVPEAVSTGPITPRSPRTCCVTRPITAIGRLAGYPVAQAFAGHAPPSVTGRYLHATLAEVAFAMGTLTGERHPLAGPHRVAFGCNRR